MKLCTSSECSDGLVFDTVQQKMVSCPLCAELREEHVLKGVSTEDGSKLGLSEKLGLRRVFSRLSVDLTQVLGSLTSTSLDKDQYDALESAIQSLVGSLSLSKKPKTSVLFYLGVRADVELLAFWILGSAYKAGLSVHPFVTPFRLQGIRQKREEYENLMLSDVVVIAYSPSIREDGYLVEDFVRQRAFEGKSTYVILTDGSQINNVLQRLGSENGYSNRQYLYIGVPRQVSTEEDKVRRTNKVISNSNAVLNLKMPEVSLEELEVAKGKNVQKASRKQKGTPKSVISASEAALFGLN
jgi:hypothetical protein